MGQMEEANHIYQALGAQGLKNLVNDFYELMHSDPRFQTVLKTHDGIEKDSSKQKLEFFLSGWLGGPQLYLETFGHPRLRMRHQRFGINLVAAQEWLMCMDEAAKKSTLTDEQRKSFLEALVPVAQMLINRS